MYKFENRARPDKTKKVAQVVGVQSKKLRKSPTLRQIICTSSKTKPDPTKTYIAGMMEVEEEEGSRFALVDFEANPHCGNSRRRRRRRRGSK